MEPGGGSPVPRAGASKARHKKLRSPSPPLQKKGGGGKENKQNYCVSPRPK